jgi:pyrroloquinoline-quinone synthase
MNQKDTILKELDELIEKRSILQHPFYQAWREGRLTIEDLATYAQIYYPHVAAFPGYLQAALQTAEDSEVRSELESNLREELGEPKAHPELWLDFASGLGLERKPVSKASPHPAAKQMVAAFEMLSKESSTSALAALYAYEAQQPEVARTKAEGLVELYGIDDPQILAYFEVHAEADLRHREGERRALERCLSDGASMDEVLQAAGQALDAYWGLLDGVCAETGVS